MNIYKEKEMIESVIGEVKDYFLSNNYGFYNKEIEVRRMLNIYGTDVDFWEVKDKTRDGQAGCVVSFNNIDEVLEHLKEM